MGLEIQKGSPCNWGVENLVTGYGIVQSGKINYPDNNVETRREDGEVANMTMYDQRSEITIETVYVTGQTMPVRGNTLNIGGLVPITGAIIKSADISLSNVEMTKITINATKYPLFLTRSMGVSPMHLPSLLWTTKSPKNAAISSGHSA